MLQVYKKDLLAKTCNIPSHPIKKQYFPECSSPLMVFITSISFSVHGVSMIRWYGSPLNQLDFHSCFDSTSFYFCKAGKVWDQVEEGTGGHIGDSTWLSLGPLQRCWNWSGWKLNSVHLPDMYTNSSHNCYLTDRFLFSSWAKVKSCKLYHQHLLQT